MNRQHARRAPKRNGGFSWGRFPTSDGAFITWRMFRRDHTSALHMHALTFTAKDEPAYVAKQLRRARRQLRDRVDEIDLAAMGVAA
ncbi:hypothetical protein [Xanthomonas prunicola]|uniref:Uncharacterized protein n=1 Tax=Xanthomonas prunicola TaxID=2053930 RepID=A0A9Q9MQB3_9XANT|nr:hypothetical protein [Xanthomonas prunicola]UXA66057.1 hypothetical protein M0D43_03150 [Xanthomonas prunicola]